MGLGHSTGAPTSRLDFPARATGRVSGGWPAIGQGHNLSLKKAPGPPSSLERQMESPFIPLIGDSAFLRCPGLDPSGALAITAQVVLPKGGG